MLHCGVVVLQLCLCSSPTCELSLPQEVDPHYQRTVMVCSKFDNRLKVRHR